MACSPTTATKTSDRAGMTPLSPARTFTDDDVMPQNSLEAYLNQTAGVTIQGAGLTASAHVGMRVQEPLFVINGNEVGNSMQIAADFVSDKKIKAIRVLRHLEAEGLYGLRSNNGVVLIKTE